jgi:hypothetical protein
MEERRYSGGTPASMALKLRICMYYYKSKRMKKEVEDEFNNHATSKMHKLKVDLFAWKV